MGAGVAALALPTGAAAAVWGRAAATDVVDLATLVLFAGVALDDGAVRDVSVGGVVGVEFATFVLLVVSGLSEGRDEGAFSALGMGVAAAGFVGSEAVETVLGARVGSVAGVVFATLGVVAVSELSDGSVELAAFPALVESVAVPAELTVDEVGGAGRAATVGNVAGVLFATLGAVVVRELRDGSVDPDVFDAASGGVAARELREGSVEPGLFEVLEVDAGVPMELVAVEAEDAVRAATVASAAGVELATLGAAAVSEPRDGSVELVPLEVVSVEVVLPEPVVATGGFSGRRAFAVV